MSRDELVCAFLDNHFFLIFDSSDLEQWSSLKDSISSYSLPSAVLEVKVRIGNVLYRIKL